MKKLLLTLALSALAIASYAGQLTVNDEDNILGSTDAITAAANKVSFEVRLIVSSKRGHGAEFDGFIDSLLQRSDMVVLGVDPKGHHSHARMGADLSVPGSMISAILSTANGDFKQMRWADGIAKIILATNDERAPVTAAAVSQPESDLSWLWLLLAFLVLAVVVWGVVAFIRRRLDTTPAFRSEYDGPEYSGRVGYSSPVVVNNGSNVLDYAIADSIIHSHRDESHVEYRPSYSAPEPSHSSHSSSGSSSSGSSDWGSSSSFGGSSGGSDFGSSGGDSGGSSW